jgi:uncharacterized membrane protein YphA (DoxX/SURF4 family)
MINKISGKNIDLGLLLVRVGLALVFIAHGWAKIGDMAGTVTFFSILQLSPFWAYLVAYTELFAGIAMLLGILTNWAGLLLAVTMIVAIALAKLSKGFLGGYEFDIVLFLGALAIVLAGPGRYTIQNILKKRE